MTGSPSIARFASPSPITLFALLSLCWFAQLASAAARPLPPEPAAPSADSTDFFEKRIRPVLSASCFKCHSAQAERVKGELMVDNRDSLLTGGENGPAIVPGDPAKSLLIKAIQYKDDKLQMPPKEQLPASVVADFVQWVKMGAPWPAGDAKPATAVAKSTYGQNYDQLRKEHWAYQPIKNPPAPAVKDAKWAKSDIDRFILARLEDQQLKPAADADKATLIRRVTFDLTGLPPTPAEIDAFTRDTSATAFEKVVDRLLASSAFGERWGRHWLDVARYAQSTGMTRNYEYPWAWRYRDWVIDMVNADLPFNQFITDQIAGDLVPVKTTEQRNFLTVATGFLAIGPRDLNQKNRLQYLMDNIDEQVDTVSKAFLATTISCARCHDHKFDPIPQTDYYALAGIFRSTITYSGYSPKPGAADRYDADMLYHLELRPKPQSAADAQRLKNLQKQLAQAEQELTELQPGRAGRAGGAGRAGRAGAAADSVPEMNTGARAGAAGGAGRAGRAGGAAAPAQPPPRAGAGAGRSPAANAPNPDAPLPVQLIAAKQLEIAKLKDEIATLTPPPSQEALVMGVHDEKSPFDTPLYQRGDVDKPGDIVKRGFPHIFASSATPPRPNTSGRLELAAWITNSDNPLTTRVIVNRIWHHLFGEGIVRTVDNFGTAGEVPTHPELLDHLAKRFVDNGWSMKKMIREIVLSRVYQEDSKHNAKAMEIDPDNRLVWRMSPKRLEAECMRDAMMAAAGTLVMGHPPIDQTNDDPTVEVRGAGGPVIAQREVASSFRSVYLPVKRNLLPDALDLFDFADPSMVTGARDTTTVSTQALYLMNDPFVLQQSRDFAMRLLLDTKLTDQARLDLAYRLALGRLPTAAERTRAGSFLNQMAPAIEPNARGGIAPAAARGASLNRANAWTALCQSLFASAEFRYLN